MSFRPPSRPRSAPARLPLWLALVAALALLCAAPAGAAMSLVPPKPDVLLGVWLPAIYGARA